MTISASGGQADTAIWVSPFQTMEPHSDPDFIFAVRTGGPTDRITVLKTKGDQLDSLDTTYKREVLSFLSSSFAS